MDFLQTNVNLRVIAKGKNMEFTWLKHGDDSDDDRSIRVDDMQYRVIRSVIKMATHLGLPPLATLC